LRGWVVDAGPGGAWTRGGPGALAADGESVCQGVWVGGAPTGAERRTITLNTRRSS
jgi:hypothetical protein